MMSCIFDSFHVGVNEPGQSKFQNIETHSTKLSTLDLPESYLILPSAMTLG